MNVKYLSVFGRNLFLDGLLYAGSAESVEAAAELLSSQQIPADAALRWYLDLNFVKHTSRGSLKALLVSLNPIGNSDFFTVKKCFLL